MGNSIHAAQRGPNEICMASASHLDAIYSIGAAWRDMATIAHPGCVRADKAVAERRSSRRYGGPVYER